MNLVAILFIKVRQISINIYNLIFIGQVSSKGIMKQENIHEVLREKYQYSKETPDFVSADGKYKIFKGVQKQIATNVSIKLLMSTIQPSLASYLNKLKSTKSDQVIRIYQIITEANFLVLITEQVNYGTVASGLANCKKLDENDALYIAKYLLTGYADVLRSGNQWNGTTNDIEVVESGMKLSWNYSPPSNLQSSNTFPQLLRQISTQKIPQTEQRLLPFPESKQLKDIFKLAEASASQISLSPIMKKKEKYIKKKLKSYLLIKQTKTPGQYFEQTIFLGISKQNGFVRVKQYKKGTINPVVVQLNKTKNTFTKLLEVIEQGNLMYMVSAYSNDGNLQSYVQRLKTAGIQLKEDQIQFFFYSMFQPLKAIQQSSIKSLNTSLHIKNIYIQSGIPKIGEPIPLNQEVKQKLKQRADVPDFYHKNFKENPQSNDPSYDTYSLGVLLHKLMFTEYPIFPDTGDKKKVRLPTTPAFSPRLIATLKILLDEGGKLIDIEKKIEVSESVLKQVKKNKQKLLNAKKLQEKKTKGQKKSYQKILAHEDDDAQKPQHKEQQEKDNQTHQQQQQIQDDCFQCCVKLQIADHAIDPQVQSLEQSPYKTYRLCTKFFCFLLLYVLLMYMFYLRDNILMITKQSSLQKLNVTISTVKYEIVTEDKAEFYLNFNQTSRVYDDLKTIGCLVKSNLTDHDYFDIVKPNSIKWLSYLSGGLGLFTLIILMKSILIFKFDYIKTKYNYQHNMSNFNYSNYLIVHLLIASLVNQHFKFFNIIFYSTLPACLGTDMSKMFSPVQFMLDGDPQFLYIHLPIICGLIVITFIHFVMVCRTDTVKYSKIFNPILLFAPFLITYWVVVRIGVLRTFFYPSALNDTQNIIRNYFFYPDYIGILGIIPQILLLFEFIINKLIDLFYWMLIDKKRRVMIQETSTQNIQLYQ